MAMVAEWFTTTRPRAVRRIQEAYVMIEVFTPSGIMSTKEQIASKAELEKP